MEPDILVISSDAPLVHVLMIIPASMRHSERRRRLLFGLAKYISGSIPPTHWLIPVAAAAPVTPHLNTPTNTASSTILVIPAASVAISPSFGFSAVVRNV